MFKCVLQCVLCDVESSMKLPCLCLLDWSIWLKYSIGNFLLLSPSCSGRGGHTACIGLNKMHNNSFFPQISQISLNCNMFNIIIYNIYNIFNIQLQSRKTRLFITLSSDAAPWKNERILVFCSPQPPDWWHHLSNDHRAGTNPVLAQHRCWRCWASQSSKSKIRNVF